MHRRQVVSWACAAGFAARALQPDAVWAQAESFHAGRDFLLVNPAAPVDAPAGKIELIEFFWYGCPHCNAFEPVLANWIKTLPADVAFRRVPVAFQSSFAAQQRLFYALEAMHLVDKLHARVFAAIHRERQQIATPQAIMAWIERQGVDAAQFAGHFQSFSTETKARRASQLTDAYQVQGVPALGVAGRFYTDGELTRNMDRALQVATFLVDQVRTGR